MKPYFQKFSEQELPASLACHTVYGQGRPVIAAPHWHREIECYLFLSGECAVQVEQQRLAAVPGDLVAVNRGQLHALYSVTGAPCAYLLLIFDYDGIAGHNCGEEVFGQDTLFDNPFRADCPEYDALCGIFRALHEEARRPGAAQPLILHGLAQQFCGLLIRSGRFRTAGLGDRVSDRSRVLIEDTFRLIHDHYALPLSLPEAARAASLSVPHFCRLFKATTGMTFVDYLSYYRARRACALLRQNATLEQAAQECGFGSTAALIRSFHKFYQAPPKTYVRGL